MYKKVSFIACIFLILDQVTKVLVDTFIEPHALIRVIDGFFYLSRTSNTGAGFSILKGRVILLIILSIAAIYLLIKYMNDFKDNKLTCLSFGLLFGGIMGNLLDRVFLGYVRDFLKFNIFSYEYPIFNIADVGIVVGVIILMICIYRGDEIESNSRRK